MEIKDVFNECIRGNFSNIKFLNLSLDEIIESLELYHQEKMSDSKEFAKDKGRLFEFIFKTGSFIKCNYITGLISDKIILYEDLKPCYSFCYTSGWKGSNDEWGADIILEDKSKSVVWAFTSKSRQNITLSKTEWRQMLNLDKNLEFKDKEIAIGFIVNNSNEFMTNRSSQLGDYKHSVLDYQNLVQIWEECRSIFNDYNWDLDKLAEAVREKRTHYVLMPHQKEGESRAFNAFSAGEKEFLFFWKCRSGKTLASLDLLFKKMKLKNVLLLTSYPAVNSQWVNTIIKFMGFENVETHNVSGDGLKDIILHPTKSNLVIISTQDSVSGDIKDGKEWAKEKFKNIEGVEWDALLLDEVHHGQETKKAIALKNRIQYKYCLALSATPWKNIALGRFGRQNTHEWGIVDEGVAKKSNPDIYGKFPEMNFYLWTLDDKIKKHLVEEGYLKEEYPTMKKLFYCSKGKLKHENLVRMMFEKWKIKIVEHGINPRHILAFLPNTRSLEPLCNLMKDIFRDFEVGFTHSGINPTAKDITSFRNKLYSKATKQGKGTIILAVGQLTTGITIKHCDCILHLDDGLSTSEYIQKSLRAQNPLEGKDTCYIFDFNPNRALRCILTTAIGSQVEKTIKERVYNFLLNAAVQMISDGKWITLDADYLIRQGVEAQIKINRNLFNIGIINQTVLNNLQESDLYRQLDNLPYNDAFVNTRNHKQPFLDPNAIGPGLNQELVEVIDHGIVSNQPIINNIENVNPLEDVEFEFGEKEKPEKKFYLTVAQKVERLTVNFSWLPAVTHFWFDNIEDIIKFLDENEEERKEFEALISRIDDKTIYPISWDYVKKILNAKDAQGRDLINLEELDKRLSVLVMDCKDNPGKANELMVTEEQYKKIFGEVFTPAELVKEMLDKLPVEVWNNKDLTWCDPACGSGNFLYWVKIRLMEGLSEVIEDEKEREKWIVENMLYGVELQRKNCYLCMFKLDPENEFKTNVACENSLEFDFWGKKFDIVVGNPPYNNEVKTKGNPQSTDLYPDFVDKGFNLLVNDGMLLFITPSRWFSKTGSAEFRENMTQKYGLMALWHNDKRDLFQDTLIEGGLSYFILQKGYDGDVYLNFLDEKFDVKNKPEILSIRNIIGVGIYEKVSKLESISNDCCPKSYFGIKTNSHLFEENSNKDSIFCFVSKQKGGHKYVPISEIKNAQDVDKWKVIFRAAEGGVKYTSFNILAKPGEICNESYVCFCFKTENEALNFISYFETKLFKYLMSIKKIKQDITKEVFDLIPKVDFSKSWTDKEIYNYFNLSQEEIDFIEETINSTSVC